MHNKNGKPDRLGKPALNSDLLKPVSEQSNDAMDMKQLESRLSDSKSKQKENVPALQLSSAGRKVGGLCVDGQPERAREHCLSQDIEMVDKQML